MDFSDHATAPNPWGTYKEQVEHLADRCSIETDLLLRNLAGLTDLEPASANGKQVSDRQRFADRVAKLHEVATELVYYCQSVERWLSECRTSIPSPYGEDKSDRCNLPKGHKGNHLRLPMSQAYLAELLGRDLAKTADRLGRHLGRLATEIDTRDPARPTLAAEQHERVKTMRSAVDGFTSDAAYLGKVLGVLDQSLEIDKTIAARPRVDREINDNKGLSR